MDIGKKIKKLRLQLNFTQEELADYAGTTKQTIHKYETGIISNIPASKIKAISEKLQTTPSYLMGWDDSSIPSPTITEEYTTFPVIGEIAAGYNHIAIQDWDGDTIDIPDSYLKGRKTDDFFVLKVCGDSMFPTYQDGDKVLVLRQDTMNYSGEIGAVIYDDEIATLKKIEYVKGEDWMRLVPINPNVPPTLIEGEDLDHCRVLGIPQLMIREIN